MILIKFIKDKIKCIKDLSLYHFILPCYHLMKNLYHFLAVTTTIMIIDFQFWSQYHSTPLFSSLIKSPLLSFTLVSIKLINLSCNQQTYLLLLKSLQSISHLFNFLLNCISKCCGIFTLRLFLILIFFLNNIFLCLINNLLHLFDIFLI